MSFEDDTVWQVYLDLYTAKAEALPITKITTCHIWTEVWSGKQIFPDGTFRNIGKRTRIRLDRDELVNCGSVRRGRIAYYFENPDSRLAPADENDPNETPIKVGSPEWRELARQDAERLRQIIDTEYGYVRITESD